MGPAYNGRMTKEDYLSAALGVLGPRLGEARIRQIVDLIPPGRLGSIGIQDFTRSVEAIAGFEDGPGHFLDLRRRGDLGVEIFLSAPDFPGLFSAVSGILSASGFETGHGSIITSSQDPHSRLRYVIDHFTGQLGAGIDYEDWSSELASTMGRLFSAYDRGDPGASAVRVKQLVIEEVAAALSRTEIQPGRIMSPMQITQIECQGCTRFEISSVDTPFFLYSLSTALSLHQVSIDGIDIRTEGDRVLDIVDLTDSLGQTITDELTLSRIKLSILLSKQFTYFVDSAPEPLRALERFDQLVQETGEVRSAEDIQRFLASADFQQELARILGASDFLWEDFIRVQHDNILPMIRNIGQNELLSTPPEELEHMIRQQLEEAAHKAVHGRQAAMDPLETLQIRLAAQVQTLNDIKNRESFLIDLDHLLVQDLDFFFLSHRLTALAEAVVRAALDLAWQEMLPRYGVPRTAAGLEAEWAVFGLGKLGGRALGYASDIELFCVYSDNGSSDGPSRISNRDFFERFFKSASTKITARREGIFKVDLRLRPHGEDGPIAVRLQSMIDYFSRDGQAHSAERLALVRLRWIAGSETLGNQVTRLRDHLVYEEDSIKIPELRSLRRRQLEEKSRSRTGGQGINAKFSPGTLVDLEYNVQILQVIHGRRYPELRVPGIHQALRHLSRIGTIDQEEAGAMTEAYQFFRKLINGLRMLRGNAQDLFMPLESELEYRYLARRIGYSRSEDVSEAEKLRIDFETHSARVRRFVERHLGRDAIPFEAAGSVVDLIISETLSDELLARVMGQAGFENHQRALVNLKSLAGDGGRREVFARLIVLVWDALSSSPDPDMALNNWEQFLRRIPDPGAHFERLLGQPKRIGILFRLFAASQFLSDTLIQNPGFFEYITDPKTVARAKDQIRFEEELRQEALSSRDRLDWLNRLRRYRKREILRIGLRDLGLGVRIEEIMGEITFLARACCELALSKVWERLSVPLLGVSGADRDQDDGPGAGAGALGQGRAAVPDQPAPADPGSLEQVSPASIPSLDQFVICGFGKLGSWELNYSSDIDLVAIYLPRGESRTEEEELIYTALMKGLVQDLTDFTQEGQAYRVDLRLRPFGASGPLVSTLNSIVEYYEKHAELWEIQALIKLKPVAGNLSLGEIFLDRTKEHFIRRWDPMTVRSNIARMRELAIQTHVGSSSQRVDVKNSRGGIRDIEFYIQGLQLIHCREFPDILRGNTLRSISILKDRSIIGALEADELSRDYRFLRNVEHYLQLAEDRQLHALPDDDFERKKLADFLSYNLADYERKDLPGQRPELFYKLLSEVMTRVHASYENFIHARPQAPE